MTVARYMTLCLGHPHYGYYMTRDPFGAGGDFVTAPEISQMFGELIGLWASRRGPQWARPSRLRLVELGPGRGTLMADLLRAARLVPAFLEAADVHLVETSPVLRAQQRQRLAGRARADRLARERVGAARGPAIVIANEFFDALPVRQFVRTREGWRERLVGLDDRGRTDLRPCGRAGPRLHGPPRRRARFWSGRKRLSTVTEALASRIVRQGGAALVVDYGH